MGVLALKLWHLLVMVAPRRDGQPPAEDSWQAHFEALQNDGLRNLNFTRTMRGILLPVMTQLATALAVPYVITRGVLPWLGLPAPALQYANLYGHQVYHGMYLLYLGLRRLRKVAVELHNAIRDDRYLVGKELNNFDGEAAAAAAAVAAAAAAEAAIAAAAAVTETEAHEPAAEVNKQTGEVAIAGAGEEAAGVAEHAAVKGGTSCLQRPADEAKGVGAVQQQQLVGDGAGSASCNADCKAPAKDSNDDTCCEDGVQMEQGIVAGGLVQRRKVASEIGPA